MGRKYTRHRYKYRGTGMGKNAKKSEKAKSKSKRGKDKRQEKNQTAPWFDAVKDSNRYFGTSPAFMRR
jgi:hypothetical protein